ncbi:MAG: hypothetical protein ACO2ZN_10895 [Paracoccaceae bacterium]
MAVRKRTSGKARAKSTKKTISKAKVDLQALLNDKLNQQPLGKALAAIDFLYQELDDMEMRLEILISRIEILKKRTEALRVGETLSVNAILGTLLGDNLEQRRKSPKSSDESSGEEASEATEWTKLKLIEETTINDVLLGTDTIVSIESRAATSLIEKGVAEAVEVTEDSKKEPNDNATEEAK